MAWDSQHIPRGVMVDFMDMDNEGQLALGITKTFRFFLYPKQHVNDMMKYISLSNLLFTCLTRSSVRMISFRPSAG